MRQLTEIEPESGTVEILSPQTERVFVVIVFQKANSNICDRVEKFVIICNFVSIKNILIFSKTVSRNLCLQASGDLGQRNKFKT